VKTKFLILFVLIGLIGYGQRAGKGNGTFVPDITFSSKFLVNVVTINALEKILPDFTMSDSTLKRVYNKYTMQHDSIEGVYYNYMFTKMHKNDSIEVYITVSTDFKQKIKEIKFYFQPSVMMFDHKKQLLSSGFKFNPKSSELGTRMNFGTTLYFYNKGKLLIVTEEPKSSFSISKLD
jgi:hypothetical protein